MIKQIGMAVAAGIILGIFFLAGRLSAPKAIYLETQSVQAKEKIFKKVQSELKYTYYSELLKKPSDEPPVSASAPAPVFVEPVMAAPDKMAQALAKVLGSETPNSVKSVIKDSLPTGTGSAYAIQVASLPNRPAAEELVQRLLKKGHRAKLVQADIPGKGSMYRIRIHGFMSREEADKYREDKQIEGITVAQ